MAQEIILLIMGFIIATASSMIGLGGGVLIVPSLILFFGVSPQKAVAISLLAMSGTTISAAFGYIRHGLVDYKLAVLYDIMDIPGVIVGAYLTVLIPSNVLAGIC